MDRHTVEGWTCTYHGLHDGTKVTIKAARDDTHPEPYGWTCTCGVSHRSSSYYDCDRSALRHAYPTLLDRLRQWAARQFRTRRAR
ncbi:hypothetical protein LT493_26150 [Streptomyces tricolor]|nr:hypothetical protein [Streptomyces tricolor]